MKRVLNHQIRILIYIFLVSVICLAAGILAGCGTSAGEGMTENGTEEVSVSREGDKAVILGEEKEETEAAFGDTAEASGDTEALIEDAENHSASSETAGAEETTAETELLTDRLPIIYLTTDDGEAVTSNTEYKTGTFSLDYNGTQVYDNIEEASIRIRGRGKSSWDLDKKPYKIKFDKKTSVFGLTAAKEWCLIASYVDGSLMRNTVALETATVLDNIVFVPTSHLVDVYLNGDYIGVYGICEQVEMKDGRIPGDRTSTAVDTDYLIEVSGDEKETSFGSNLVGTVLLQGVTIDAPDEDVLTQEQWDFVYDYLYDLDCSILYGEDYSVYLDVPSLVDYFLLLEFTYNTDGAFRRSNYLYKQAGGLVYMAAPWDYDYAFGNMSLDTYTYDDWISDGNEKTDAYNEYIFRNWMTYLLSEPNFQAAVQERWAEVGEAMRDKALETIDTLEEACASSAEHNFEIWPTLGTKVQYQSLQTAELTTYEEQVQFLRDFVQNRYEWMDQAIAAW